MGEYDFLHFPADQVHVEQEVLDGLPESARRIWGFVRDHGPVTHATLRTLTDMPPRTIRFAVKRLKEAGIVDTRCSLQDCRTCYFFVDRRCVGLAALEAAREAASQAQARGEKVIEHV